MAELLRVDVEEWKAQLPQFREHLAQFDRLPRELDAQLAALEARLALTQRPGSLGTPGRLFVAVGLAGGCRRA